VIDFLQLIIKDIARLQYDKSEFVYNSHKFIVTIPVRKPVMERVFVKAGYIRTNPYVAQKQL